LKQNQRGLKRGKMRILCCAIVAVCLTFSGRAATAPEILKAIRSNDLAALRAMTRQELAETRDPRNWGSLHYAALYGSEDALKIVLGAGADPNARNQSGATPLILAAYSFEKTRLLVEKGADVNARANNGTTSLFVAAGSPANERTVRYLLEKGADVKYLLPGGEDYLMRAAERTNPNLVRLLLEKGLDPHRASESGDTALTDSYRYPEQGIARLLISAGADVNAANTSAGSVKNGPIDSFGVTPLMLAAGFDDPAGTSALVKAGANLDTADHRHMTALMMAIATDRVNPANVRLLVEAGAAVNIKDRYGETALDWARKYRNPEVIAILEKAKAAEKGLPPAPLKDPKYRPDAREAVVRAAALLTKSSQEFFPAGGGCVGCHHQPFAARAFAALRSAGLSADPLLRHALLDGLKAERPRRMILLQFLRAFGGGIDQFLYPLAGLADIGEPGNDFTDAMVHYIAETQEPSGEWTLQVSRPPLQESNVTRTMLAIGALKSYGWPARQTEFDERIARARTWLMKSTAWTTVDEADRIQGLSLAGASTADLKEFGRQLIAQQRSDGGWAQTNYLDSDAFGTSSVLYALRGSGLVKTSDPVYQRGVRYLVDTQFPDGSWYVRSRAVKLQPYFQSAFPYDHDQWISNSATAYAVMVLAPTVDRVPLTAQTK
jgi:ankyrin repeat protein